MCVLRFFYYEIAKVRIKGKWAVTYEDTHRIKIKLVDEYHYRLRSCGDCVGDTYLPAFSFVVKSFLWMDLPAPLGLYVSLTCESLYRTCIGNASKKFTKKDE